jgi:hypothetical protein
MHSSNMRTLRQHLDTQYADIGRTDGKQKITHCLDGISETADVFAQAAKRVCTHSYPSIVLTLSNMDYRYACNRV